MSTIKFKSKVEEIADWKVVRLTDAASAKLPSRGLVLVEGKINDFSFHVALEPDGKKGHWFALDKATAKGAAVTVGDSVDLEVEPMKEWPEPEVPADLKAALDRDEAACRVWMDTTTMARWDWIRSIRATKNPETRKKRIEVACSKLKSGKRRPCCFDRSQCTEPDVSKSGVLID